MKAIIEENYKSIVNRGLINKGTDRIAFLDKLFEEVGEFEEAIYNSDSENTKEELSDIILVCLNFAKHYDIDIEKELNKKIQINKNR